MLVICTYDQREEGEGNNVLVFPAASRPSMSSRISLFPQIFRIILDIPRPMAATMSVVTGNMESPMRRLCCRYKASPAGQMVEVGFFELFRQRS